MKKIITHFLVCSTATFLFAFSNCIVAQTKVDENKAVVLKASNVNGQQVYETKISLTRIVALMSNGFLVFIWQN